VEEGRLEKWSCKERSREVEKDQPGRKLRLPPGVSPAAPLFYLNPKPKQAKNLKPISPVPVRKGPTNRNLVVPPTWSSD